MVGGFNTSPLRLNSYLQQTDEWNELTIKARASELADKARQVWQVPFINDDVLEQYRKKHVNVDEYSLSHYPYLTDDTLSLYQQLNPSYIENENFFSQYHIILQKSPAFGSEKTHFVYDYAHKL